MFFKKYNERISKLEEAVAEMDVIYTARLAKMEQKLLYYQRMMRRYVDRNVEKNIRFVSDCIEYLNNKLDYSEMGSREIVHDELEYVIQAIEDRFILIKRDVMASEARTGAEISMVLGRIDQLVDSLRSIRGWTENLGKTVLFSATPEVFRDLSQLLYPALKPFNVDAVQVVMYHLRFPLFVLNKGELSVHKRIYKVNTGAEHLKSCIDKYGIEILTVKEADQLGKIMQPPMIYRPQRDPFLARSVIRQVRVGDLIIDPDNSKVRGNNKKFISLMPDIKQNGIRNPVRAARWIGSKEYKTTELRLEDGHNRLTCAKNLNSSTITVEEDIWVGADLNSNLYFYEFNILDVI